MLKEYVKIRLKTNEVGRILEILGNDSYMAEIFTNNGDIETTEIKHTDISSFFEEVEHPLVSAV